MISTCDNRMVVAPPEGRALWLLHDGALLHLMASTSLMPAKLTLTLQNCFDARILRVDTRNKRIFLRPVEKEEEFECLNNVLRRCALVKVPNSGIKLSSVYICVVENNIFRGVVTKMTDSVQSFLVYAIDTGEEFLVGEKCFFELEAKVRDVPPLCICVVLSGCAMLDSCEEFDKLLDGTYCVCSLDKVYPSGYPERVKELYPPAIVSHLYLKDNNSSKFSEISCSAQEWHNDLTPNMLGSVTHDRFGKRSDYGKSTNHLYNKRLLPKPDLYLSLVLENKVHYPKYELEPARFQFPKYRVHLPFTVNVLVTRRTSFATYVMRDTYIITKVQAHIKHPCNLLMTESCILKGAACIVRVKRLKDSRLQLYRAVLLQSSSRRNTCVAYLVDYGQRVTCDYDQVFDLQDQPPVILETPVAAFKCRVRRVWRRKGLKVNKLLDEEGYRVCLTFKCGSKAYWGVVLPQTLMYTDISFEDMEDYNGEVFQSPILEHVGDTTEVHEYLKEFSEEETVVSSLEDETDYDNNQDLRLLQAKAESIKRHENMTLLSAMLQELSCRVDAMEAMAGCSGWAPCVPTMCTTAFGYNQPAYGVGNSSSPGQNIRYPIAYLPQFPFDPNVPPPHFQFYNQGSFEQFPHFTMTRPCDTKYDSEHSCESNESMKLQENLVHEKLIYKTSLQENSIESPCRENHQNKASSNLAEPNDEYDAWKSSSVVGLCESDSLLHEVDQNGSARSQEIAAGRYSYASALKKGLHSKNRGKVIFLSSNDKKKKVRNIVR